MERIYNYTRKALEDYFTSIGEKSFKGRQVFEWLYRHKVKSFDEMTSLKKDLRDKLKEDFTFDGIKLLKKQEGKDVIKYLFKLIDNEFVEAVLMKQVYGNSLCISTEVGCNMGCTFCESGRLKLHKKLEVYEIVMQILLAEEDLKERISHVVFMGIGEPFDNYDNFIKAVELINDDLGLAIGARHITVSTCGLVPKIKEFMDFPYQVNLAISLHAATDEVRDKLMPINKVYPLDVLIPVLKEYIVKTGRRLTVEYILIKDINDREIDAHNLVNLLKDMNVYINLIPYNETSHIAYKRPSNNQIMKFYDIIKKSNIAVTIRKEFGGEIDAACGQLRSKQKENL